MKILALEFSSRLRSVAVYDSASTRSISFVSEEYGRKTAMVLVDEAVRSAGISPEDIELLAAGLGPGSYAGIRSAIAIAQGWELARGTMSVGISSAECLAETVRRQGVRGERAIVIDAQRSEFYRERFLLEETLAKSIEPLRIVPAAAVEAGLAIGPDHGGWHPSAAVLAELAVDRPSVSAAGLEPIYLRAASFVKAPPPRSY